MKVELLYFAGCPTYRDVEALIEDVVRSEGVPAEIEVEEVKTAEEAVQLRFPGSPTIRVDGVDIDPLARASRDFGLKCRVYREGKRFTGVPPREMLQRAIKEARNGQDCCASNS